MAYVIFVAICILIVIGSTLNKTRRDGVPFAEEALKVTARESKDGHSTSLANNKMEKSIAAQRKLGLARGALLNVSFPFESGMLRKKLRDDLSFALGYPEPERDIMLATIGERFAAQFSATGDEVNLLFERLILYEDVLREFNYSVESGGFSMRSVIESVTDPLKTEHSGLREDSVIQAYRDSKSKLLGRIAGMMIAKRLATMGPIELTEINTIEDKELRINTERETIRMLSLLGGNNLSGAVSYYMSQNCEFGNEHAFVVELFGSAFKKFPEDTSEVVFDAPKGIKRDSAIMQMVVRMGKDDPEASLAWIKEISDPGIRSRAEEFYHKKTPLSQVPLPEHSNAPDPFAQ